MMRHAPAALLDERPRERLGEVERPLEVGVDHGVPLLLAHAHEQVVAGHAGVVHEDVHSAGVVENLPGGGIDRGRVGHIHRHRPSPAAKRLHLDGGLGRVFLRAGDAGHVGPHPGVGEGHRAADPPARAGHHGDFVS